MNEVKREAASPVVQMKVAGDMADAPPLIQIVKNTSNLGGSVEVIDEEVLDNSHTAEWQSQGHIPPRATYHPGPHTTQFDVSEDNSSAEGQHDVTVQSTGFGLTNSDEALKFFDQHDAAKVKHLGAITGGSETFVRLCKRLDLPFEVHLIFHNWLVQYKRINAKAIPMEAYTKILPGMDIPYPSGRMWNLMIKRGSRKKRRANHTDVDNNEAAVTAAEEWLESELTEQRQAMRNGVMFACMISAANSVMAARVQKKFKKKKKRTKAVGSGLEAAPANVRGALEHPDCEQWVESMGNEFNGLVDMGVFDCGYTLDQCRSEGCNGKPVPLGTYYEIKRGSEGQQTKKKTRIAVKGHPGNMTKGIHFNETYAATPKENSSRVLCALVVLMNLTRLCFDITKAYCWANLPPGELIALRYPDGYQQYDPDTNEELYIIMRKNLYGHPSAGRTFAQQRDAAIMEKFNNNGWSCRKCKMDPCMFVLNKTYLEDGVEVVRYCWMVVHVDDCDGAGQGDQIMQDMLKVCKSIWKCEEVPANYMLGIKRTLTYKPDGTVAQCHNTMVPFVEGMAKAFEEHLPKAESKTPMPPKITFSKIDKIAVGEDKAVLAAGYMCLIGMVLWAARHCFPECRVGCSLLCRVMARPSWAAWNAGLHMLKWMLQQRQVGIKFSSDGNLTPVGFVDASNKPDAADGKCQYGFNLMWMGGPIMEISKKLRHIGLSSEHNEYMAMCFANQAIVWMRQLFMEMGLDEYVKEPTVLFADNIPANTLAKEDIVTSGNQYIFLPYHYNKEVQEEGHSLVAYIVSGDNLSDLLTKAVGTKEISTLYEGLTGHNLELVLKYAAKAAELTSGDVPVIQI